LNKAVILGYDSNIPQLYDSGNDLVNFEDIGLTPIIDAWKKKAIKVVTADNKDEVLKWFHQNGGITDRLDFIKGKESYGVDLW
jgi:hypothetical protein